ncbi:MAG: TolC family protein [Bacteroidia bacterium]|nr:TolC family protein [Bacteroidia bacterium]
MKNKSLYTIVLIFCLCGSAFAQQKMTVEDAVSIALENNFDIRLVENAEEIAKNNTSIYNSGFLPSVTANGNANYSNTNTTFTTQQGVENNINGAEIQSYGSSIGINYLLFNGGARKLQYGKLKRQYELASVQKRLQIENTLIEVYTAYFNIARSQEQRLTLLEAVEISSDRLLRVTAQQKYGQKTSLDVLNAQVDANADSMNLIQVESNLLAAKQGLNLLLGRAIATSFTVDPEVQFLPGLKIEELRSQMVTNNAQLQQAFANKELSSYDLSISKAAWIPTVSAAASYGINYSDNGRVGFFQNQQSAGLNSSVTLSWDIFNGGRTLVQTQNSKLSLEQQSITEEKIKLSLENQLSAFWLDYQTQKAVIATEEGNMEVSQENFSKSKELFQLGQITSLDFRQSQLNLMQTKLNLTNAMFDAKIAELQLIRFAGLLK